MAWPFLKQTFVSVDVHEPPDEPPLPLPPLPLPPVPGLLLLLEEQAIEETMTPPRARAKKPAGTFRNLDELILIPS